MAALAGRDSADGSPKARYTRKMSIARTTDSSV
jgi:hypothetical protein